MPEDVDKIFAAAAAASEKNGAEPKKVRLSSAEPFVPDTPKDPFWEDMDRDHPEGERDNYLTRLIGHYIRVSEKAGEPYDKCVKLIEDWDATWCKPPMASESGRKAFLALVGTKWKRLAEEPRKEYEEEEEDDEEEAGEREIEILGYDEMMADDPAGAFRWFSEDFLMEGGIHVVISEPSGGKSFTGMGLCRAMTQGENFLGKVVPTGTIAYFDDEMGKSLTKRRWRKMGVGRGAFFICKQGLKLDVRADRTEMKKIIRELGADVVVLDTITRFHSLDENKSGDVGKIYGFLQDLQKARGKDEAGNPIPVTIIFFHHENKNGDGSEQSRIRGSTDWAAFVDMGFRIQKRGEVFHLFAVKNRLTEEGQAFSCHYVIEDNPDKTQTWIRVLDGDERNKRAAGKIGDQIVDVLTDKGPMNVTTLNSHIKGSPNAVAQALKALEANKQVASRKEGKSLVYEAMNPFEEREEEDVAEQVEGSGTG